MPSESPTFGISCDYHVWVIYLDSWFYFVVVEIFSKFCQTSISCWFTASWPQTPPWIFRHQQPGIDAASHQAKSLILISACVRVMCSAWFTTLPQKDFPALRLPSSPRRAENVPFSFKCVSVVLISHVYGCLLACFMFILFSHLIRWSSAVFMVLVLKANVCFLCFVFVYNKNKDVGVAVVVLTLKRRTRYDFCGASSNLLCFLNIHTDLGQILQFNKVPLWPHASWPPADTGGVFDRGAKIEQ